MEYASTPYDLVSQQQWEDIWAMRIMFLKSWWNVEDILNVGDTDVYMWPFLGYLAQVELLYLDVQHLV